MHNLNDSLPEWAVKPVLVLGCGNILFGDDGFGPAVIEHLFKNYKMPENVCALDAGCSVRKILFPITISAPRPTQIIIVDAVDAGRQPGEIFEAPIDDLPENKMDDFSMHQVPTSNLLKELKCLCGVDVRVLVCQTAFIPEEVQPGLSDAIRAAVPRMGGLIMNLLRQSGSAGNETGGRHDNVVGKNSYSWRRCSYAKEDTDC